MKNSDDSYNLYFINAFPSKNSWREMKVEKKKRKKHNLTTLSWKTNIPCFAPTYFVSKVNFA